MTVAAVQASDRAGRRPAGPTAAVASRQRPRRHPPAISGETTAARSLPATARPPVRDDRRGGPRGDDRRAPPRRPARPRPGRGPRPDDRRGGACRAGQRRDGRGPPPGLPPRRVRRRQGQARHGQAPPPRRPPLTGRPRSGARRSCGISPGFRRPSRTITPGSALS